MRYNQYIARAHVQPSLEVPANLQAEAVRLCFVRMAVIKGYFREWDDGEVDYLFTTQVRFREIFDNWRDPS